MSRVGSVSGNCGAAATDTAVYIDESTGGGQKITRLDIATGAFLYSSPVMAGTTDQNCPFLSPDGGTVYFSRTQNSPSVDLLFAFQDTGNLSPKTAVDRNGNVCVSNGWASDPASDGRLWAFNADLLVNLFALQLDRQNAGGPAMGEDGTMVVADRQGVYAYRTSWNDLGFALAGSGGAPLVDTEMAGNQQKIRKMPPDRFARLVLDGMRRDRYELRVGLTGLLYWMMRLGPLLTQWLVSKG